MANAPLPDESPRESLLGHLESIRSLLDQDNIDTTANLQQDIIENSAEFSLAMDELDEKATEQAKDHQIEPTAEATTDAPPLLEVRAENLPSLRDTALQHLLGTDWQTQTDAMLADARSQIAQAHQDWNPEDTAELSEALKVRIDATVNDWLNRTLVQQLGDLRGTLLTAVSDELSTQLDVRLAQNTQQRLDKEQRLTDLSKPFLDNDCA